MDALTMILTVVIGGLLLYRYASKNFSHFQDLGLRHVQPVPILGNMAPILFRRINFHEYMRQLYNKFSGEKYFGFYQYNTPIYVIRDPEVITAIAVKNFDSFVDHTDTIDEELNPLLARNLFFLRGDDWREMRRAVSPAFTSGKMKMMFELFGECAEQFVGSLRTLARNGVDFDMKDLICRYTVDVVASCAFGVTVNSIEDPGNEFFVFSRKHMNFEGDLSLKFFLTSLFKRLPKSLRLRLFPKQVNEFFLRLVERTVRLREENRVSRPDMIQLLMESREKGTRMSITDMTSHAFLFFFAGFDSTATFMCFLCHEIGMNPEVKEKLLAEIEGVLKETNGKPSYEAISQMKYLDAVINETLRLYPLTAIMDRVCTKQYHLPPPRDGITEPVSLKPGDIIWFSGHCLHRDPNYFPEPNTFRPDRFLKREVENTVYMPFGLGPRLCVGNRFAILVSKMMLFHLLACCEIEPCEKTPRRIEFSKKGFIMLSEKGFWLKLRARESCLLRGS